MSSPPKPLQKEIHKSMTTAMLAILVAFIGFIYDSGRKYHNFLPVKLPLMELKISKKLSSVGAFEHTMRSFDNINLLSDEYFWNHPHILERSCPRWTCKTNKGYWCLSDFSNFITDAQTCWTLGPLCKEHVWSLHRPEWLHGGCGGQYPRSEAAAVAGLEQKRKKEHKTGAISHHKYSLTLYIFSIASGTGGATLFTCFCHIIGCSRRQVVERFTGELADHAGRKWSQALIHKQVYLINMEGWKNTRTYPSQWFIFMAVRWSTMALVYSGKPAMYTLTTQSSSL